MLSFDIVFMAGSSGTLKGVFTLCNCECIFFFIFSFLFYFFNHFLIFGHTLLSVCNQYTFFLHTLWMWDDLLIDFHVNVVKDLYVYKYMKKEILVWYQIFDFLDI